MFRIKQSYFFSRRVHVVLHNSSTLISLHEQLPSLTIIILLLYVRAQKNPYLMGPLSSAAGQIVRFTDDPAFSICRGPPGFSGGGGAVGNNKAP